MNATAYRFFKAENFIKWRETVPRDFRYVVKVPRLITHQKLLADTTDLIKQFYQLAILLENKLGLLLLQISPLMPYDLNKLKKALLAFEDRKKIVVEFRHKKWFNNDVKELLQEFNCTFCSADSPKIDLQNWLTSDIAYIRLHGHDCWFNYNYSASEIKKIALFAKKMVRQGAKTVYIFFNNDEHAYAIHNAFALKKILKS